MVTRREASVRISVEDAQFLSAMRRANNRIGGLSNSFRSLTGSIAAGNVAAIAFTNSISLLGREVSNVASATLNLDRIYRRLNFAGGDVQAGRDEFRFLREEADRLGFSLLDAADSYSRFSASTQLAGLSIEQTREAFLGVAEAAAVLGLDSNRLRLALLAVEQIASKGVVSMEELRRQLGEHIPGALGIAADAMGVTVEEMNRLVESGELLSTTFLPLFGAQLREVFAGDLPEAVRSVHAEIGRLQTALDLARESFGQQLLPTITQGIERLTAALDSPRFQQGLIDVADLGLGLAQFGIENARVIAGTGAGLAAGAITSASVRAGGRFYEAGRQSLHLREIDRQIREARADNDLRTASSLYRQREAVDARFAGRIAGAGRLAGPIANIAVGTIIADEIITGGGIIDRVEQLAEAATRENLPFGGRALTDPAARYGRVQPPEVNLDTIDRELLRLQEREQQLEILLRQGTTRQDRSFFDLDAPVLRNRGFATDPSSFFTPPIEDIRTELDANRIMQRFLLNALQRAVDATIIRGSEEIGRFFQVVEARQDARSQSFYDQDALQIPEERFNIGRVPFPDRYDENYARNRLAFRAYHDARAEELRLYHEGIDRLSIAAFDDVLDLVRIDQARTGFLGERTRPGIGLGAGRRVLQEYTDEQEQGERLLRHYQLLDAARQQEADAIEGIADSISGDLANALLQGENLFRAFGESILQTLLQLATNQFISPLLQTGLSAIGSSLGFSFGGGPSGQSHIGAFPQAHAGGFVTRQGIMPLRGDEVPAILQTGETVLPRGAGTTVVINNQVPGVEVVEDEEDPEIGIRKLIVQTVATDISRGGLTRRAIEGAI